MLARMSSWRDLPRHCRNGTAGFPCSDRVTQLDLYAHIGTIFKMLRVKRRELLLSLTHGIGPTWNPRWGSWTPFWRRVVRCHFPTHLTLSHALIDSCLN